MPANVFLSDGNPVATSRCLYYDNGHPIQRLDAAACVEGNCVVLQPPGIESEDWLKEWDRTGTEGGAQAKVYEGNIKVCADLGMRLPVLYETQVANPQNFWPSINLAPRAIFYSDEAAVSYSFVPPIETKRDNDSYYLTWTATARSIMTATADMGENAKAYFIFDGDKSGGWGGAYHFNTTFPAAAVRCVLPSH